MPSIWEDKKRRDEELDKESAKEKFARQFRSGINSANASDEQKNKDEAQRKKEEEEQKKKRDNRQASATILNGSSSASKKIMSA